MVAVRLPSPGTTASGGQTGLERPDVLAASLPPSSVAAAFSRWAVPSLPAGFNLGTAVAQATHQALAHYQTLLQPEGLQVGVHQNVALTPQAGTPVEGAAHIQVQEGETGRVMRVYTQNDFLTLFASQRQASGVVVDGQV